MKSQQDGSRRLTSEEGRSARKRRAIIDAAVGLFLTNGFRGTSVDQIAAEAGVSKQTVYKHFADKERLFEEIMLSTIDQVGQPFFERIATLEETAALEEDLRELARRLIAVTTDRRLLQVRRLVIGEAERFPHLARAYYERGPARTIEELSTRFQRLAGRGLLRIEDAAMAGHQFNWLVLSIPLNRLMLAPDEEYTASELERVADEAVRIFLAAYGTHASR